MASEWNEEPLSALADLSGGFAFKSADYAPVGRFILRTLNISDDGSINREDAVYLPEELCPQYSRFELRPEDTLFVMVGATLGKVGFVRQKDLPALLNQNMWLVRARPERADSRFVHYAFHHAVKDSLGWASGSARDFVRRDDYRNLKIPAPPLAEQRSIAHILGTLDDKIELNRRMSETLEAMARALFKSWFVDFEPVRAKIEGRWQHGQSLPGLPAHLYNIFPDRLVDSELGEIPDGWGEKTIDDLAEIVGGSTPSTVQPAYWDDGIHCWVTPKDLSALRTPVLLNTERRVTDAGLAQISSGLLPKGTVLLSSRAPIGYLAIAEVPVAINQGFIAMKPRTDVPNLFLLLWARAAHEDILARANGSTFLEISKANFRPLRVVEPSLSVLDAFDRIARPLYERIVSNVRESSALAAMRDTLLPKLISGELCVSDAERFVGASL